MRRLLNFHVRISLICLLVIGHLSTAPMTLAQEHAGDVTELSGTGRLQRAGQERQLAVADVIDINDKLMTDKQSRLTVALRAAGILTLDESTSVVIDRSMLLPSARNGGAIGLLGGYLRVLLAPVGSGGDFQVHTPNAVIGARGTEFEVKYVEGRPCPEVHSCLRYTTAGVYDGVVVVFNPASPNLPVTVTKGYETTVACELPPTSPAPLGMEDLGMPGYR